MGDFFKGWRRKTGCVVLVMASVLAAGWGRSVSLVDTIWYRRDERTAYAINSLDESLLFVRVHDTDQGPGTRFDTIDIITNPAELRFRNSMSRWCGFGICAAKNNPNDPIMNLGVCVIPYW